MLQAQAAKMMIYWWRDDIPMIRGREYIKRAEEIGLVFG